MCTSALYGTFFLVALVCTARNLPFGARAGISSMMQIGRPKEIYRRPASLFVADFAGSPSINKIEGTAVAGAVVQTPYSGLEQGRNVVAAVRPESIALAEAPGPNVLEARIRTLLPACPRTVLQASLQGERGTVLSNVLLYGEVDQPNGDCVGPLAEDML